MRIQLSSIKPDMKEIYKKVKQYHSYKFLLKNCSLWLIMGLSLFLNQFIHFLKISQFQWYTLVDITCISEISLKSSVKESIKRSWDQPNENCRPLGKKKTKTAITHLLDAYHLVHIRLSFSHILCHFIFTITPWHSIFNPIFA